MKIYTILFIAVAAALLFAMPFALAENETETADSTTVDQETAAEINDDLNESVSGMKIGWERVKLAFTFNNEKKAMQELKIARLRLVQARVAAKNGNEQAMQNALEAHERIMERVKLRVNAIDGASDSEGAKLAVTKLVGLERAIEVHEARISKLGEIIASENLTEAQRARVENQISKMQSTTENLREVQATKKENLKTKLRAVGDMTEEEVDAAIEEIEEKQNLSAVKQLVSEVRARHMENIQNRIEIRKNVWNNLSEETQEEVKNAVRSEVEQRLEDAKAKAGKSE